MRLVHAFSPMEEICVVFDDNDRPATVSFGRESELPVGTVVRARAAKKTAAGWFLDIGGGRNAYLNPASYHIDVNGKVTQAPLNEGDGVIARLSRPATEDKEPEADFKISLAGEYVVFMPAQKEVSFSRQLSDNAVSRLRSICDDARIKFRTAAQRASDDEIKAEIAALTDRWQALLSSSQKTGVLFRPEKDVFTLAEKFRDRLDEIVTDDASTAAALKQRGFDVAFCHSNAWAKENLDAAVQEAAATRSPLPSGGFVMTEQTAACVCFDVNAGGASPDKANEEACAEIARQMALKSLGGQMIIDFAGAKDKKKLSGLITRLKAAGVHVVGASTLGLVESVADKVRLSLFDEFAPNRAAWRQAADVARRLWFAAPVQPVRVGAPLAVLNALRPYVGVIEDRLKTNIALFSADSVIVEGVPHESA